MQIYLKLDNNTKIESEEVFDLNQFAVSKACGYSFNSQIQEYVISEQGNELQQRFVYQLSDKLFKKMKLCYLQHRIDQAYHNRNLYLNELSKSKLNIPENHLMLIKQIQQQMKDVLEYQKQFDLKDWIHKKNGKNYHVYTKHFDDTVAVLMDAEIEVPIQKFIFIINQFDLMKNFMPFMEQSKEVKEIARNCKIGHIVNNFPILSKRQAFFQGIGYDRLNHDSTMLLFSRSLHNRPDLQQKLGYKVMVNQDAVQLQYKFFLVQYKPYCKQKGRIKIAMNVDMKLSVPKFILDPVTQNFGKDFLKNVLHVTNNFKDSQWQRRSIQKTQFTDFIRTTIQKYFSNKTK